MNIFKGIKNLFKKEECECCKTGTCPIPTKKEDLKKKFQNMKKNMR